MNKQSARFILAFIAACLAVFAVGYFVPTRILSMIGAGAFLSIASVVFCRIVYVAIWGNGNE